jgi:hypothetical protein
MGGKSRKTGGISRALVERLKAMQEGKAAGAPPKAEKQKDASAESERLNKALKDLEG